MISVRLAERWEPAAERQIAQSKTADKPRLCKKSGFVVFGGRGARQCNWVTKFRRGRIIPSNAKLTAITANYLNIGHMVKVEEIIELARQRGIRWKSQIVGIVCGLITGTILIGAAKLIDLPSGALLLAGGGLGYLLGYLAWLSSCRIPRNKPNMIGVALAIQYETQDERKRIRSDFIQEIAACLSRSEASQPFYVYEIPGYLAPDMKDIEGAAAFLKKSRCHLLIWGNIRTRKRGKTETFCLRLEGAITHTVIEQERSKALAHDLRLAIPDKTEIELADELQGFESASDSISRGTQYIVALAAAISGDWNFSRALLTELHHNAGASNRLKRGSKKKTKGTKKQQEAWQALVPDRLASVCFAQAHANILHWQDDKTNTEYLVNAEEALEAYRTTSRDIENIGYWINKALLEVTLRQDLAAAERLLNKCRAGAINDPIWRLSLAFVHVVKGSPETALELYDAALERDVPAKQLLDIEDYVQWWLKLHSGPSELYLLSALLNANGKHDIELALADLKIFEASASFINSALLRHRATQLRNELESHSLAKGTAIPSRLAALSAPMPLGSASD